MAIARAGMAALRRGVAAAPRPVTARGYGYGASPLHGNPLGHAPVTPLMPGIGSMEMHATTILSVRKKGKVVVIGDGQVTRGSEVVKPNAVKVRRIGDGSVISGFAGSTADCLALRERLETKLEAHPGQLTRACVELAKEWRTEKYLRRLEAVMLVVDKDVSLTITGIGDVMEPVDGIIAIGSGGSYALAAARALLDTDLDAMAIAEKAMNIAATMCVYTNHNFVKDEIVFGSEGTSAAVEAGAPAPVVPQV